MTLPNQPSLEWPLLLELERAGGSVHPGLAFYDRVAAHFPAIALQDRQLLRSDGRTKVWENTVDWARNSLLQRGHLRGGKGDGWQITNDGKKRLREDLAKLGLQSSDVESFIKGSDSLPQRLGQRWNPPPLKLRTRAPKKPKSLEPTVRPQPDVQPEADTTQPEVAPPPAPSPVPPPDIRAQLLARLQALTPTLFEHLVKQFLRALGLGEPQVTQYSHDGGIDGYCDTPFLGVRIGFQAKRFAAGQPVGIQLMHEFKGSLASHNRERGIFVTTSHFTDGAEEASRLPGIPVILVNGRTLVEQMLEKGLGIRRVPVTRDEIDEQFFGHLNS